MATLHSQSLPPMINGNDPPVSDHGFPMLAVAALGIFATAFLLVSYYIFVTNCCFRLQIVNPLGRFSFRLSQPNESPLTSSYSPSWQISRGLNELLIRDIPTFRYGPEFTGPSKCVVCLTEFQDQETLRVLPKCSHAFHLDCIDVWLLANSNCPLCRSAISGRNRYIPRPETTVEPNYSLPQVGDVSDEFVEIVISRGDDVERRERSDSRRFQKVWKSNYNKAKKLRRVSIMGDEGIDVRVKDEDRFFVKPIRRSFSMDSVVDRHVHLSVQEIIRQNRGIDEARNINNEDESGSSRSRRSIFSFGHGRGSRNAVLPVD